MELYSAPYLVDPVDFGLGNPAKNKLKLDQLKLLPSKVVGTWQGSALTQYSKSSKDYFIVLESEEGYIMYLVHVKEQKFKQLPGNQATQVAVWRSTLHTSYVRGLAAYIFTKILLARYRFVVSDDAQTDAGRRFWEDMLSVAVSKGYTVGFFDVDQPTLNTFDPASTHFVTWMFEVASKAWGKRQNKHAYIRLFIGR